jgi:hypothetical protein
MKDERDTKQLQDDELEKVAGGTEEKKDYFSPNPIKSDDGRVRCWNYGRTVGGGPLPWLTGWKLCDHCTRQNTPQCQDGWQY